jgi:hypothetical protein
VRKAKYDRRKVICRKASCIGYSSNVAKPGYWVSFVGGSGELCIGRVIGRIAETDFEGTDCRGYLAVMTLSCECTHSFVRWVNPDDVRHCYETPPAALLTWITGADWVKSAADVARLIAMSQHGATSDQFIATRNDPEKAYNARPEYVNQWVLK